MTRPRHPTSKKFLTDSELQTIVNSYFARQSERNNDFWDRVEEQRQAAQIVNKATKKIGSMVRDQCAVFEEDEKKSTYVRQEIEQYRIRPRFGMMEEVENRRWWQTHPLYVGLFVAFLFGLCLVLPDLPEILEKLCG